MYFILINLITNFDHNQLFSFSKFQCSDSNFYVKNFKKVTLREKRVIIKAVDNNMKCKQIRNTLETYEKRGNFYLRCP